jgi:hypothetical protein
VQGVVTAGAAVVVLAFDIGAGQALKSDPPAPPAARDAAIALDLEGDARRAHKVVVEDITGLPPEDVTRLVGDGGRLVAYVRPLNDADCNRDSDLLSAGYTGPETKRWCLQIERAPDHGAVTGALAGRALPGSDVGPTKLAVTVQTRDAFRGPPGLVVLGGLVGSLLIALGTAAWTPLVKGRRLAVLIDKGKNIEGLAQRAAALRDDGKSVGDVLAIIGPVVKRGPARADAARAALSQALAKSTLPADHPYRVAAQAEAARTDYVIDDFLDEAGSTVNPPAKEFQAQLATMERYAAQATAAKAEIDNRLKESCKRAPLEAWEAAEVAWSQVDAPAQVATLAAPFATARTLLNQKLAPSANCLKPTLKSASADWQRQDTEIGVAAPTPVALGQIGRVTALAGLGVLTGLLILLCLVGAGAGVWAATFDPVKTFGDMHDYVVLAIAALGTGVVASVTAVLKPWRS